MIKKLFKISLLVIVSSIIFCQNLSAQQNPLLTQYPYNKYVINPAVAGTRGLSQINTAYRSQWTYVDGAPTTMSISAHGGLIDNHSMGAYYISDVTGAYENNYFEFAYAYKVRLSWSGYLSMGAGAMINIVRFNGSKVNTYLPDDPYMTYIDETYYYPDLRLGLYYYDTKSYLGVSASNVIQTKYNFNKLNGGEFAQMFRHYYVFGGYKFKTTLEQLSFVPNAMVRITEHNPVQFDINAKFIIMDFAMIEFGYRYKESFLTHLGVFYKNFSLCYSHDFPLTSLNTVSGGTHEVVLGYHVGFKSWFGN